MPSENDLPKPRTLGDLVYQFLLGGTLGVVLAMLPAFYISTSIIAWKNLYIGFLGALVIVCGILGMLVGKRFLRALISFLESIPPVA